VFENFDKIINKKIIVVAPHADDETLEAGGLLAKLSSLGWETHVLFATISGFPAMFRNQHSRSEDRNDEVVSAMKVLGVSGYKVLFRGEEKHLKLDTVPQTVLISFIEKNIKKIKPSICVMPGRGHYHQDHRALSDACVAALRPAPHSSSRPFVPIVIAYGHSSLGWGGDQFGFQPSVFVDISDHIDTKLKALECYTSQLCLPPHPRSLEKTKMFSSIWGNHCGVEFAEPFECIRFVF